MALEKCIAQLEAEHAALREQVALVAVKVQDVHARTRVTQCPKLAARGKMCHPEHMLGQLLSSRSTAPGDVVRRHRMGEGRDRQQQESSP